MHKKAPNDPHSKDATSLEVIEHKDHSFSLQKHHLASYNHIFNGSVHHTYTSREIQGKLNKSVHGLSQPPTEITD